MQAQLRELIRENERLREELADACDRARRYAEELLKLETESHSEQ